MSSTGTPIPRAPGFIAGDRPQIVTSRFAYDDSYTLDRYLATGGYDGLKAALAKTPQAVHDEVRTATVLGRGGAGFPAGVKWGLTPQGVWPRYLVVNGDESEPGTYKDRLLMELDPHQLIEGCLIACYAAGLSQCFLYIRGEMAVAQERVADGAQRGLRRRLRRQEHPRQRPVRRHRHAVGRRRLRRRRGDGADREPRGQPRHAAAEAAVLPGGDRPVRPADDRQQRRDAVQPAVAAASTAPPPTRPSAARRRPAPAWSRSPGTSSGRVSSRSSTARRRSAR